MTDDEGSRENGGKSQVPFQGTEINNEDFKFTRLEAFEPPTRNCASSYFPSAHTFVPFETGPPPGPFLGPGLLVGSTTHISQYELLGIAISRGHFQNELDSDIYLTMLIIISQLNNANNYLPALNRHLHQYEL